MTVICGDAARNRAFYQDGAEQLWDSRQSPRACLKLAPPGNRVHDRK